MCVITFAKVHVRMQRRVVRLESMYITLSMKSGVTVQYCCQLPLKNSNILSIPMEKQWRLGGQQVVLLMNEDFGSCTL